VNADADGSVAYNRRSSARSDGSAGKQALWLQILRNQRRFAHERDNHAAISGRA
jgi:hypothetical protein